MINIIYSEQEYTRQRCSKQKACCQHIYPHYRSTVTLTLLIHPYIHNLLGTLILNKCTLNEIRLKGI